MGMSGGVVRKLGPLLNDCFVYTKGRNRKNMKIVYYIRRKLRNKVYK